MYLYEIDVKSLNHERADVFKPTSMEKRERWRITREAKIKQEKKFWGKKFYASSNREGTS